MAAMEKLGPNVEVSPATKRIWQELKQEIVSSKTPMERELLSVALYRFRSLQHSLQQYLSPTFATSALRDDIHKECTGNSMREAGWRRT